MKSFLLLSFLLVASCSFKNYRGDGERNMTINLQTSHGVGRARFLNVWIHQYNKDCSRKEIGQLRIKNNARETIHIPTNAIVGFFTVIEVKQFMGSNSTFHEQGIFKTQARPGAHYEMQYTEEDKAISRDFYEIKNGKKVELKNVVQNGCPGALTE